MTGKTVLALVALCGCPATMKTAGYPPNPARTEPPPNIQQTALAVGAPAPTFRLPTTSGDTLSLTDELNGGPVILVFYRGHW
jgi:hypothetical protein